MAGKASSWFHYVHSQEAERGRKASGQLIFNSVWDLSLWNAAPTLRVGLPTSVNLV